MGIMDVFFGKIEYEGGVNAVADKKYDDMGLGNLTPVQQGILSHHGLGSVDKFFKIWVYNLCVRKIAQTAARVFDFSFLENTKTGEAVKDNAVFNLLTNKCNNLYDGQEQIEILVTHYITNGNCYEYVVGTPKMPIEVWPLLAQNVTPETGEYWADGQHIKGYTDTTSGHSTPYPIEKIIHCKTANILDHTVGVPWLAAAAEKLETLAATERYNHQIKKNGSFPSINWHTENHMSGDAAREVRKQIREQYAGVENAGKDIITHSGFQAKSMSFSPKDMEVLESEKYTAGIIATSLGVPPEILGGLTDKKTYLNYEQAWKDFMRGTVFVVLGKIIKKRNYYFWPDGQFKIKINEKLIDAFKQNSADLAAAYWLTPDQKLEAQGYSPTGEEYMQKRYITAGMVPMEDLGEIQETEVL